MTKGNKKDLNGKVEKIDFTQPRSYWAKAEDPALQEKRAKDLRKSRYQSAQNAVARELRDKQEQEARDQKIKDDKFDLILATCKKEEK